MIITFSKTCFSNLAVPQKLQLAELQIVSFSASISELRQRIKNPGYLPKANSQHLAKI
ncbi:MAG: hypothetical protein WA919_07390 [Coleofasciculaceae cyanobacterium]